MRQAFVKRFIRAATALVVVAAALAATAQAQAQAPQGSAGRLRLDSLERLAPRAAETVDIEIDGFLVKFAGAILSDADAEERAVKEVIKDLKGIYVRSYEFKSEGQFGEGDLAALREQLRAPGWSRVLDVESRGLDFDAAEVYMATSGERVEGFVLLVVEPKALTVANIVGAVDIAKLRGLGGMVIPRVSIKRKRGAGN